MNIDDISTLFFDVGGTIFDWKNTAKTQIELLAQAHGEQIDSERFAVDWRTEMFRVHTQVRHGDLEWMNADMMHLLALEELAARYPLLRAVDLNRLIIDTWHNLRPFPGAAEAMTRLRGRYTVIVLTILSFESIVNSSKRAGVLWDGILSCELLGVYKPSLQAYVGAAQLLSVEPENAMMVAAHEADLAAAARAGMHTTLVTVPEEDHVSAGFGEAASAVFDIEAHDFTELCRKLGV